MEQDSQLDDRGKSRTHFTMIPNMAGKDLDPFEYRLYGHYAEVCGQDGGRCWQSLNTIHEKTGMSIGAVTKTRNSLQAKGYIDVVLPDNKARRGGENTSVGIVDRWQENTERFQELIAKVSTKKLTRNNDSPFVPAKEEVLQEKQEQEKRQTDLVANSEPVPSGLVDESVSPEILKITVFTPEKPQGETFEQTLAAAAPALQDVYFKALATANPPEGKHQDTPEPRFPPDPLPPEVQREYVAKWAKTPTPEERADLVQIVKKHGEVAALSQIVITGHEDSTGAKIRKPARFMLRTLDNQKLEGKARSHSQESPKEKVYGDGSMLRLIGSKQEVSHVPG